MNRVGLCRQDSFRFFLRDRGGKRLTRYGNVCRNIRDHFHSAMNILIQEVSAKLRVKNATHKKNERHDQQNRNERDKQVANNQAVAQTPEQAIPPSTERSEERRVGKSVDLGGRRIIKKKKKKKSWKQTNHKT